MKPPIYEKYQIHSPNGAVEIEESLCPVRLRFWEHILFSVQREMYGEIIIDFFHPFGAKFIIFKEESGYEDGNRYGVYAVGFSKHGL